MTRQQKLSAKDAGMSTWQSTTLENLYNANLACCLRMQLPVHANDKE